MNNKVYKNRFKGRVLIISIIIIFAISLCFFTQNDFSTQASSGNTDELIQAEGIDEIQMIVVREDSLVNLLNRFMLRRNIASPKSSIVKDGDKLKIDLAYFGPNTAEFYNNSKLLKGRFKGFKIEIQNGEIKVEFRRLRSSGTAYIELPSDILYKLVKDQL